MAGIILNEDRWGRTVGLAESRWNDHILENHPELVGNLDCIKIALADPTCVTYDVDDPDRENFYRAFILSAPFSQTYLKVCVRYKMNRDGSVEGFIKTAYSTKTIKRGETQKWPIVGS